MAYTDDQVIDALDAVPEAVRDAATSISTVKLVSSFVQKYGLHIDTVGKVAELNRNLLLGLTSPAEFLGELVLAGVDANTARQIMAELNEKIFVPTQQKMRESGASPRPMSAPTPSSVPESVSAPVIKAAIPQTPAPMTEVVVVPAQPTRTAPPPPNLPGTEEIAAPQPKPVQAQAVQPVVSARMQAPLPQTVLASRADPIPVPKPVAPVPVAVAAPVVMPVPTAPLPPKPATPVPPITIYSTQPPQEMPSLKPEPPAAAEMMWQTPLPPAWQKIEKGEINQLATPSSAPVVSAPIPVSIPTDPTDRPVARTMESDMQLAAQMAQGTQQPQAASAQPSMMRSAPMPARSEVYISTPTPEPAMSAANPMPTRAYVPPPRVSAATVVAPISGDPYREPIEGGGI